MFSQLIAHYTQYHWEPRVKFATFIQSEAFVFFFTFWKTYSHPRLLVALHRYYWRSSQNEQQISLIYWLVQVNLLIPAFGSLAGGRDWLVFRSSELDYNIHTSPNKTDSPRQATGVESKWADVKAPSIYPFLAPLCCTWLTRVGHVSSSAHAARLLGTSLWLTQSPRLSVLMFWPGLTALIGPRVWLCVGPID